MPASSFTCAPGRIGDKRRIRRQTFNLLNLLRYARRDTLELIGTGAVNMGIPGISTGYPHYDALGELPAVQLGMRR